jgi:hypothetical protein
MIYLLTAIGLPPGGSYTLHIYTQIIHRTTQNKQYLEHKHFENNTKYLVQINKWPLSGSNLKILVSIFASLISKINQRTAIKFGTGSKKN